MIDTLNELLIRPGVVRAIKLPWVLKHIDGFKLFLGTFFLSALNKGSNILKRLLSLGNLILINFVVLAYFAGKSNAHSISEWFNVFLDYKIWLGKTIVVNLVCLLGRYLLDMLKMALTIAGIFIMGLLIFLGIRWLIEKFSLAKSTTETIGK